MNGRTQKWIACLIDGLDKHLDDATKVKILEQCGRLCQSPRLVKQAKDLYRKSKNIDDFLGKLAKANSHVHRQQGNVYLIYPKCYCTQVNKLPKGKLSATYCNCSRGWAKALFEGALGRPVDVVMEETIIRGDKQCKFRIVL